jgi:hypothetical protein
MTLREETALHMTLLKALVDRLGAARATAAETLKSTWHVGDRTAGALPSGVVIGSVTYGKGATRAAVTDRAEFEAWVTATHPGEMETVTTTRVRPAYEALLVNAAKQLGVAIDATTGEEVPGIGVRQGDPFPSVRMAKDADEAIAEAWQNGELTELVGGILRPQIETVPAGEL